MNYDEVERLLEEEQGMIEGLLKRVSKLERLVALLGALEVIEGVLKKEDEERK